MSWSGKKIKDTFKDLLKINSASDNAGVDSTLREVQDGNGTNTALKLSTTEVNASNFTATKGTITELISGNVDIDGGSIDGVSIGTNNPDTASFKKLGINGPLTAEKLNIHIQDSYPDRSTISKTFSSKPTYFELNGSIFENLESKTISHTFLEFIPENSAQKGNAWFELELFSSSVSSEAENATGGTGYSNNVTVQTLPDSCYHSFPDTTGEWGAGIHVQKGDTAVHYTSGGTNYQGNIGYIWGVKSVVASGTGTNFAVYTGSSNPLGAPSNPRNFEETRTEAGNGGTITWEYVGQTPRVTLTIGTGHYAGQITGATIHNDLYDLSDANSEFLQGFLYAGLTGTAANEFTFFNYTAYVAGTRTITLEKSDGGSWTTDHGISYAMEADAEVAYNPQMFLRLRIKSVPSSGIEAGDNFRLVEKQADGTVVRAILMTADFNGGRAGNCSFSFAETGHSGVTASAYGVTERRLGGGSNPNWKIQGITSLTFSGTSSDMVPPSLYSATGERSFFGRWKGFIASRGSWDKTSGFNPSESNTGGILHWWNNARQLEFKKGKILDGIRYGTTAFGNALNLDSVLLNDASDANDRLAQFDRLVGRVVNKSTDGANTLSVDANSAVIFKEDSSADPIELYNSEKFGSKDDFDAMKVLYDKTHSDSGGGDAGTTAAKVAILDWPNFGNAYTDNLSNTTNAPGTHCAVYPLLRDIRYFYNLVEADATGIFTDILPNESNEGSFFIEVQPTFTNIQTLYIGYRLKVWTTPGYIKKIRKINFQL